MKHKNVQTRKISKVLEHMLLLTFLPFWVTGSLSLNAINLETGICEPHQQIYHVTNSYGHVTISQWSYRFLNKPFLKIIKSCFLIKERLQRLLLYAFFNTLYM